MRAHIAYKINGVIKKKLITVLPVWNLKYLREYFSIHSVQNSIKLKTYSNLSYLGAAEGKILLQLNVNNLQTSYGFYFMPSDISVITEKGITRSEISAKTVTMPEKNIFIHFGYVDAEAIQRIKEATNCDYVFESWNQPYPYFDNINLLNSLFTKILEDEYGWQSTCNIDSNTEDTFLKGMYGQGKVWSTSQIMVYLRTYYNYSGISGMVNITDGRPRIYFRICSLDYHSGIIEIPDRNIISMTTVPAKEKHYNEAVEKRDSLPLFQFYQERYKAFDEDPDNIYSAAASAAGMQEYSGYMNEYKTKTRRYIKDKTYTVYKISRKQPFRRQDIYKQIKINGKQYNIAEINRMDNYLYELRLYQVLIY